MATIVLGIAVLVVIALVGVLVGTIDDWSRDLNQNYAETSADSKDPELRPIESAVAPNELASATERAVKSLPRWEEAGRATEGEVVELHLVRTTPLMRFKDDIHARIEPAATGSRLTATSKSRVGKGDLGQNPRNLKELLGAVKAELAGNQ